MHVREAKEQQGGKEAGARRWVQTAEAKRSEAGVRVGGLLAAWLALQLMRTQRYHLAFL